jgi:hypothetical protein
MLRLQDTIALLSGWVVLFSPIFLNALVNPMNVFTIEYQVGMFITYILIFIGILSLKTS